MDANRQPPELEPGCIRTYSLDEVAAMVLPPEMKWPRRWLAERLNSGEIQGYKVGRTWRMTRDDVEELIDKRRNPPKRPNHEPGSLPLSMTVTTSRRLAGGAPVAPSSVADGLSERSRRRLRSRSPNTPR